MVHNQEESLNRFPLLAPHYPQSELRRCGQKLLLTLFLHVYLTGQKDCQETPIKQ